MGDQRGLRRRRAGLGARARDRPRARQRQRRRGRARPPAGRVRPAARAHAGLRAAPSRRRTTASPPCAAAAGRARRSCCGCERDDRVRPARGRAARIAVIDVLVIGAGPYGLAAAKAARDKGLEHPHRRPPMAFWREHMPAGMFLRCGLGLAPRPGRRADLRALSGARDPRGPDPARALPRLRRLVHDPGRARRRGRARRGPHARAPLHGDAGLGRDDRGPLRSSPPPASRTSRTARSGRATASTPATSSTSAATPAPAC